MRIGMGLMGLRVSGSHGLIEDFSLYTYITIVHQYTS